MTFDKTRLPDPASYFENRGHTVRGNGKHFRVRCEIHGGEDANLSINRANGAFYCFSCGAKGGDVLAYEMQADGIDFVSAAKLLGAWVDDGTPQEHYKPSPLSARQALAVIALESTLTAVAAGNVANGVTLTDIDLARLMVAANRINQLAEAFQ